LIAVALVSSSINLRIAGVSPREFQRFRRLSDNLAAFSKSSIRVSSVISRCLSNSRRSFAETETSPLSIRMILLTDHSMASATCCWVKPFASRASRTARLMRLRALSGQSSEGMLPLVPWYRHLSHAASWQVGMSHYATSRIRRPRNTR
jgi:hypothetical protein